jgi:hypothetical protein
VKDLHMQYENPDLTEMIEVVNAYIEPSNKVLSKEEIASKTDVAAFMIGNSGLINKLSDAERIAFVSTLIAAAEKFPNNLCIFTSAVEYLHAAIQK